MFSIIDNSWPVQHYAYIDIMHQQRKGLDIFGVADVIVIVFDGMLYSERWLCYVFYLLFCLLFALLLMLSFFILAQQ
jgi:hypothetical protein